MRDLDRLTFAQWVASLGLSATAARFFDAYCRSALGMTADEISAWSVVGFLQAEWEPTLTRPGGTAYLAERMSESIGTKRQRRGRAVLRIAREGEGALITSTDETGGDVRTMRARKVIFAAPKYVARHVVTDASPEHRAAWSAFSFRPYIVANLALTELEPGLAYDNWLHRVGDEPAEARLVTDFIVADAQERRGRGGRGVLTAYCPVLPPFDRTQVLTDSFEAWTGRIVSALAPTLPGLRDRIVAVDLFRWGHALVESPPGFVFGPKRADAMRPLGPIHFAHTDVDGVPAVESAIGQGARAADEVARSLKRSG